MGFVKVLSCFCCCILSLLYAFQANANDDIVHDYLKTHTIEEAAAQLFIVGVPSDYTNLSSDVETREILSLNVGGVMINAYNLPSYSLDKYSKEEAFSLMSGYIRDLRRLSNNGSDLLISADFESSRFTSIKYPLSPPPAAMTLSTTNDTKNAYLAGRITGYQLQSLGVNLVFGPVLDLSRPIQGSLNTALKNRAWSSDPNITTSMVSRYIDGVKEFKLALIAKHLPGFGSVDKNPHSSEEARYTGSLRTLTEEISVFNKVADSIDGGMTSHVSVGVTGIEDPMTVSKSLMKEIFLSPNFLAGALKKKVVITDDLSNMSAILAYMDRKGWGYSDLALESFKAGHDMLLFSHVQEHSNFHIDDLRASISAIANYASTGEGKPRFYEALGRVLSLKKRVLDKDTEVGIRPLKHMDFSAVSIFKESDFSDMTHYLESVYQQAFVQLSMNAQTADLAFIQRLGRNQKIVFYARNKYFDNIQGNIKDSRVIMRQRDRSSYRGKKGYERLRDLLLSDLKKGSYVVFVAENKEDLDLVHYVYLYGQVYLPRLLVSVHESPEIIPLDLLSGVNIVGNFSQDPNSILPLLQVLSGINQPNSLNLTPIDLRDGVYFDVASRPELKIDDSSKQKKPFFKTQQEQKLSQKIEEIKRQFYWALAVSLLPIFVLMLLFVYFISSYIDALTDMPKKREVWKGLNPAHWVKRHPMLACLLLVLVLFEMNIFIPDSWLYNYLTEKTDSFTNGLATDAANKAKEVAPDIFSDRITYW